MKVEEFIKNQRLCVRPLTEKHLFRHCANGKLFVDVKEFESSVTQLLMVHGVSCIETIGGNSVRLLRKELNKQESVVSELVYSTESKEHENNIKKESNQLDDLTQWEIEQDIADSWDLYDRINGTNK